MFAGTSVGSVVLWDLREHSSNHYRLKIGEDEWTLRQPTFSTGMLHMMLDRYITDVYLLLSFTIAYLKFCYIKNVVDN